MSTTVWLIQQPRGLKKDTGYWEPDLSSATKFGNIVPILDPNERPSLLPVPSFQKIKRALTHGYKEGDFFLWAGGDPCALFMAGAVSRDLGVHEVQFLRWERTRSAETGERVGGFYIPTTVRWAEGAFK